MRSPCSFRAIVVPLAAVVSLASARTSLGLDEARADPVGLAMRRGEVAAMRGDRASAVLFDTEALEKIAEIPADRRSSRMAEAELLLRRLYRLAGAEGRYAEVVPIFERWAMDGQGAPAGDEAGLRALARLYAGAAAVYSGATVERGRETWTPLGFLERWWLIGPFDNERGGGFDVVYGPQRDARPDADVSHPGKVRDVSWRSLPYAPLTGWVELDALMRPDEQALAYAMTFVRCQRSTPAALRLGTSESYRVWLNGEEVGARRVRRDMRFDQDALGLRLREGWNTILLKLSGEEGRWQFRARLTGVDGSPLEGWTEDWPPLDASLAPAPAAREAAEAPDSPEDKGPVVVASDALKGLEARLLETPGDARLHYLRGALLRERRAHDVSEHPDREALERAVKLHEEPVPPIYYYLLGVASRREIGVQADRDANAWRVALERAARGSPPSLVARLELATYYLETFGNLERSASITRGVLEAHPGWLEARLLLGRIEERLGYPRALERALEACLEHAPDAPRSLRFRAETLLDRGEPGGAVDILERLVTRNRLDRTSLELLVDTLLDLGRPGDALSRLAWFLEVLPHDTAIRERIVRCHEGWNELEAALEAQLTLVALAPDDHTYRRHEGDLLWRLGRREEARLAWQAALALQPNYPELREHLELLQNREDPLVEEFRRDSTDLIDRVRREEITDDDPAETVLDLTAVRVLADGKVKEFHQEILRVLNDRGVRMFDAYRTYYAEGDERLEFKVARVVHRDGGEERARLGVFSGGERGSGEYRPAQVDLPPLRPGDVIEIQYVREDLHQSFFGDYFGRIELFQGNLPTREKTLVLRAPASRTIHFHYRNLDLTPEIQRDQDAETITYRWTRRDVAKLRPEPAMPDRREILPVLEMSTFEDWQSFSSWYWNLVEEQFESSPEIETKVRELISGADTTREKIRALYDFVVQEIRYNAWEFGVHGFKPYNAPTIFSRRFGDCKDKATLLTVMLAGAGIPSYPVLIHATSSRSREDLSLPLVNHFNHCITYVPPGADHEEMYLDGTAQHNRLEELPASDRGARVLIVRPDGGKLATIPWNDAGELSVKEDIQVDLAADGSATLDIRGTAIGDFGASLRRFFEVPGKRRRSLERVYGSRLAGVSIESEEFSELGKLEEPVSYRFRLHVPKLLQTAPDGMSMASLDDFFMSSRSLAGLGSDEEREHDLVLGAPRRTSLSVTVHLPPSLSPRSLPESRSFENRFGRLELSVESAEGRVSFRRVIEISAPRVSRDEYPAFRELSAALDRLREEQWIFASREGTSPSREPVGASPGSS